MKRKVSNAKLRRNILSVYHQATSDERADGLLWYETAHNDAQAIADSHNIPLSHAVGVIAAISPGLDWGRNLIDTDRLISAHITRHKIPSVGAYGFKNIRKAIRILEGEHPLSVLPVATSPKTRAFYACILDPLQADAVTVDRHAKCLAFNKLTGRDLFGVVRLAEYKRLAEIYIEIALVVGLLPHQLQAITWLAWKRIVLETVPF